MAFSGIKYVDLTAQVRAARGGEVADTEPLARRMQRGKLLIALAEPLPEPRDASTLLAHPERVRAHVHEGGEGPRPVAFTNRALVQIHGGPLRWETGGKSLEVLTLPADIALALLLAVHGEDAREIVINPSSDAELRLERRAAEALIAGRPYSRSGAKPPRVSHRPEPWLGKLTRALSGVGEMASALADSLAEPGDDDAAPSGAVGHAGEPLSGAGERIVGDLIELMNAHAGTPLAGCFFETAAVGDVLHVTVYTSSALSPGARTKIVAEMSARHASKVILSFAVGTIADVEGCLPGGAPVPPADLAALDDLPGAPQPAPSPDPAPARPASPPRAREDSSPPRYDYIPLDPE